MAAMAAATEVLSSSLFVPGSSAYNLWTRLYELESLHAWPRDLLPFIVLYAIPQRLILVGEAIADVPYTRQTLLLDGDERASASIAPYQPLARTHRWIRLNDMMPKPTSHGVLAVFPDSSVIWAGGQLGGVGGTRDVHVMRDVRDMNPNRNWTSTTAAPMIDARYAACHTIIIPTPATPRLYIAGGEHDRKTPMSSAEYYTPSTNMWTKVAPMLRPRSWATGGEWNHRFYVFGGQTDTAVTDTAEYYDTTTDTWQAIAPMPRARHHHRAVFIPQLNSFAIIGGFMGDELYKDIDVYDPKLDLWSILSYEIPEDASYNTAALYADSSLYIIGGTGAWCKNMTTPLYNSFAALLSSSSSSSSSNSNSNTDSNGWIHIPLVAPHLHNCQAVILP